MAISSFRFENLPRSTQTVILAVVLVGLAGVFYFFYLKDMIAERDAIDEDIHKLEKTVAEGTAIESRLKRFRQELAQLEERLAVLQSILPSEKETPTVLRSVQVMATSSNLKIKKFTPQPVAPHDFYSDWPIKIEVEGNYNGLGSFFEKISQATRIIDVGAITIEGLDKQEGQGRTLAAACTATTFVFREDQEQAAKRVETTVNKKKRR